MGRKKILTPPPVKILALKYDIPTAQPEKIRNGKEIGNLQADLIIVAAYGQIIPKEILQVPRYGSLNVHPSLLPKKRGPSPIQETILKGDKETGVTIMLMDEKIDHGKIISSIKHQVSRKATYGELSKELAKLGADLLIKTILSWVKGEINPRAQDESKATFTKIIRKERGKIDWKKKAQTIEREIRAFNPWPSSYCFYRKEGRELMLKVLEADFQGQDSNFRETGKTFLASDGKITVQTGKDFLIIHELQLEGRKPLTATDFLRGQADFIGTILK